MSDTPIYEQLCLDIRWEPLIDPPVQDGDFYINERNGRVWIWTDDEWREL